MKAQTILLSALLLLVPDLIVRAQTTWEVTNDGNTFTIERSGDIHEAVSVLYRTVGLSAFPGENIGTREGKLNFNADEPSKTVTVPEYASPNLEYYRYQNGTTRSYRFEVTDQGGFFLASCDRSYTFGNDVPANIMEMHNINVNDGTITVTDAGYAQNYHNIDYSAFSSDAVKDYFNFIGAQLRMTLSFNAREKDDGYQYVQIYANTPADTDHTDTGAGKGEPGSCSHARYVAGFSIADNGLSTYYPYTFPALNYGSNCGEVHPWSDNNSDLCNQLFTTDGRATDGRIILPTSLSSLYVRFNASGNSGDTWYVQNVKAHLQAAETTAPSRVRVNVAGNNFAHGNPVYVSISFNEIVTISGSPRQLNTNWGTLEYIGGSGSNVLSFGGVISDDASEKLTINSYDGTIADLAGNVLSGSFLYYTSADITASFAYPVTYDLGGGTNPNGNPSSYTYDDSIYHLGKPSRPGCRFLGWTGSNGTTPQKSVSIPAHSHGPRHYVAVWEVLWGADEGADGTADHPFVITTPEDLVYLSEQVRGDANGANPYLYTYFQLGAHIDMSGVSNFAPIGTQTYNSNSGRYTDKPFAGNFDGRGFTISNLTCRYSFESAALGLFGYLLSTASVSNIVLENANIENNGKGGFAGAVIGDNTRGTVSGCLVIGGSVTSQRPGNNPIIGSGSHAGVGHYRNVLHNGTMESDIFTLTLPSGVSLVSAGESVTHNNVTYYVGGSALCLSYTGAAPSEGQSLLVTVNGAPATDNGNGTWTATMPNADATVSASIVSDATKTITAREAGFANQTRYWTTFFHPTLNYQLPAGAQAFTMKEDKALYRVGDGTVIPANCAVVIMADSASLTLTATDATATPESGNILRGESAATSASSLVTGNQRVYVLSASGGAVGFFEYTGEIPAGKAYYVE